MMRTQIRLSALIALFTVFLALSIPLCCRRCSGSEGLGDHHGHPDLPGRRSGAEPHVLLRAAVPGGPGAVLSLSRWYDSLTGKKADKTYKIVYLENEYLRIGILPEIGGRIFEGVDKTNGYNFIYRQHVIKPTLISILGAWISGGVEWNIPHHHRATSFLPIEYKVEEAADGSRTVWIGELELRDRMRWAVGYTLRPGKSVPGSPLADSESHARSRLPCCASPTWRSTSTTSTRSSSRRPRSTAPATSSAPSRNGRSPTRAAKARLRRPST